MEIKNIVVIDTRDLGNHIRNKLIEAGLLPRDSPAENSYMVFLVPVPSGFTAQLISEGVPYIYVMEAAAAAAPSALAKEDTRCLSSIR